MSTNILTSSYMPAAKQGPTNALIGKFRTLVSALAEAKAAADHYETLIARGVPPGEASSTVFHTHFGQR